MTILVFLICFLTLRNGVIAGPDPGAGGRVFDVRTFGAKGDGHTLDTRAIQAAIDSCAREGGRVCLGGGRFLSGTLVMRSHVTLEILEGATLLGSTNIADYPSIPSPIPSTVDIYHTQSLILGIDLQDVSLIGRGTLDGQGGSFAPRPKPKPERYKDRPIGIRLIRCRNVLVEGLTMRNSAKWMQHYFACERVTIRGIAVDNNCNMNNDMIDIDGCRDVTIADCIGETDDDAITLKSTAQYACENVTITNCVVGSHCNAIKLGTESCGGFRNITISNNIIRPTKHDSVIFGTRNGLGGIVLTVVDGGTLDGVMIDNIRIDGPRTTIFVRLGDRGRTPQPATSRPRVGVLRNVAISNVLATGADSTGCSITGLPGHPVEDIHISDVRMSFAGGAGPDRAHREVPEKPEDYPESTMFGVLPGYGMYIRHARGIVLRNVECHAYRPETRPALDADDVTNFRLDGAQVDAPASDEASIRLSDCADVEIRGSGTANQAGVFVDVRGPRTRDIRLMANDLTKVQRVIRVAGDVPRNAVLESGDLERK